MSIHTQDPWDGRARTYFYCPNGCGICGPLRRTVQQAITDHDLHAVVCSGRAS